MRGEAIRLYFTETVSIKTKDKSNIDGMILKKGKKQSGNAIAPNESMVMFCNPNAAFYEYAVDHYSDWIEFYFEHGYDICLWNYRGYGRSEGYPNLKNILLDAEEVVQYLRTIKGVKKLIIHGESLGGTVATHVAHKCGCEFLFVDRTFCDFVLLVKVSFGKVLALLVKWVAFWNLEITHKFIDANCYKVVANDSNDTMIHELASLRSGLARFAVFILFDLFIS